MTLRGLVRTGQRTTWAAVMVIMVACTGAATPAASPSRGSGGSMLPSPSASAVPVMGTVTLADDGCTFSASAGVDAGPVRLVMLNEADGQFDVDLWRIDDGHGFDEFVAHVAEEMRRTEAGEAPLGHPTFARLVAEASADAGSEAELEADLPAGTYAVACILFAESSVPGGYWAGGPIEVR